MISDPFFLISLLISPLIAFASTAVVVESVLIFFKIKQGRTSFILRLLPSISLFLDTLSSSLSIGYWLNPLNCSSCVQKVLLTLFFPELKNYLDTNKISLLSHLGSGVSHTVFSVVFITFSIVVLYFTLCKLFEGFILSKTLQSMMKCESICSRPIENRLLSAALEENKAKIFESENIDIPMATYSKAIFMPKNIVEQYPQGEFEAILAHELEHVRWKDPIVRFFMQLLIGIFWWVPTRSWLKKLEFDQEIACDHSILKYGIKEDFLVSAMLKVTAATKKETHLALCYLSTEKHPILLRLQIILGLSTTYSKRHSRISFIVLAVGLIISILCVFIK